MLENNVKRVKWGLEFIKQLKPCEWNYTAPLNDGRKHFGLIAQDLNEIAPYDDYGFISFKDGYMCVNYYELIGPMIKSIQQLNEEVERLKEEIKTMREGK